MSYIRFVTTMRSIVVHYAAYKNLHAEDTVAAIRTFISMNCLVSGTFATKRLQFRQNVSRLKRCYHQAQ